MKRKVVGIVIVLAICAVVFRSPPGCGRWKSSVGYETCTACQSTRATHLPSGTVEICYKAPGFDSCVHTWRTGVSTVVETLVADGQVVLVNKGSTHGAFILRNQAVYRDPSLEEVEYEWWYRTDGKGTFRRTESRDYRHGSGRDSHIQFGPFAIMWSSKSVGKGRIYYEHFAGDRGITPLSVRICVSDESDIEAVDCTDDRWVYKASPIDM